jgi:predicted AlkP superfamily pyrophosphatase or phosphodiesterase
MKHSRFSFLITFLILTANACQLPPAQSGQPETAAERDVFSQPRLVVGIVVDQMRYDYLYRYWDKYGDGGIKRLLREGFSCENAHYNYFPTYTGPGHAAVYSGTTPAVNGIIGNEWYVRQTRQPMYVVSDTTVQTVGSFTAAGQMSPRNMLTSTITDELRLFNNMQSRVIGVCLKDRGSILPAGHTANAAYWYDGATGNWITSTFYMNELPAWVQEFNARKLPEKYLSEAWTTLLPQEQYAESLPDDQPFEQPFRGQTNSAFPHNLPELKKPNGGNELLSRTPFGNTYTLEFALEALRQENLGKGDYPDFLALSFSSTDYVGHQFGPFSIEVQDTYLRLDQDLERLLNFLDEHVGKDNVLVFLTADHGAANVPAHMQQVRIPAGVFSTKPVMDSLQSHLSQLYGPGQWVENYVNQQVYLDRTLIRSKKINLVEIQQRTAEFLMQFRGVASTITATDLPKLSSNDVAVRRIQKGYHPQRSGDVIIVLEPAWFDAPYAARGGTTHGSHYPYDSHIPLLWYGWKIRPGSTNAPVTIADIAPTVAALLRIMEPNGTTGEPIEAVLGR